MFLPEQYSKDLWSYSDNPYYDNTNHKMIREINRNGKLVSAKYDTSTMEHYKTSRETTEIRVILEYSDGKTADISLNLILLGTAHNKDDSIYFIKDSVLDIIEQINNQI